MGEVLIGRKIGPSGFGRLVAIKRLHPHLASDPAARAMFLAEGRLAAHIRHGKVVATLDIAEPDDGSLLLVMDFVEGVSLASLLGTLRANGIELPRSIASALVIDLLEGLHAAHETRGDDGQSLGLIHRDVSPQNLLIGRDGIARVIDFGIARAATIVPNDTRTGEIKGKLAYMPPEQARGEELTRASDIYAAGAVLWECLTLRRFRGGDDDAKIAQILVPDIDPPSRFARGLAPEVDDVVLEALADDPKRRFPTALAMADALAKVLPPAPAREVAAFIAEHVAAATLPALSTPRLEETNSNATVTAVTVALPARPKRPFIAMAIGVAAVGAIAILAPRLIPVHTAPPAAPPPPVESAAEPVTTTTATAEPEPSATPSATPRRRKTAPATKPKDPCAVPYELDDQGLRHYKRECIR